MKGVGVGGRLRGLKMAAGVGLLAEVGPGRAAKGQGESVGVEGLDRRDWSLAVEAGGPVCQVEEVGVQKLHCSTPS